MFKHLSILTCVVLGFLVPVSVAGQSALVTGRVKAADNTPIEGAQVTGVRTQGGRTVTEQTDASGRFAVIGLYRGQWLFTVEKLGYDFSQSIVNLRRTGRTEIDFTLTINPFNPPVPENGRLAGIQATKIQQELAEAHLRFDEGDFDGAIKSYTAILERVPSLTALYLEIGHAYIEKQDFRKAQEAYESVPPHTAAAEEAATAIQSLK